MSPSAAICAAVSAFTCAVESLAIWSVPSASTWPLVRLARALVLSSAICAVVRPATASVPRPGKPLLVIAAMSALEKVAMSSADRAENCTEAGRRHLRGRQRLDLRCVHRADLQAREAGDRAGVERGDLLVRKALDGVGAEAGDRLVGDRRDIGGGEGRKCHRRRRVLPFARSSAPSPARATTLRPVLYREHPDLSLVRLAMALVPAVAIWAVPSPAITSVPKPAGPASRSRATAVERVAMSLASSTPSCSEVSDMIWSGERASTWRGAEGVDLVGAQAGDDDVLKAAI